MGTTTDTDSIGKEIRSGLRELGVPIHEIPQFLKSPTGMALSFWAMDSVWGGLGKIAFHSSKEEWSENNPQDYCPTPQVLNCHTHYVEPGNGKGGTHWGRQYRLGAHNHWWFFPEAYEFSLDDGGEIQVTPRDPNVYHLHTKDAYISQMLHAFSAQDQKAKFILMPAPGRVPLMNGSATDLASQIHMRTTASEFNSIIGSEVCYVAGVIINSQGAPRAPEEIEENPSNAWKIYPAEANWSQAGQKWLNNDLPRALDSLLEATDQKQTICIHWWDGAATPWEDDKLGPLTIKDPDDELHKILERYQGINFVMFHACYPFHSDLAKLLDAHDNLFAEIGGTFANQILGLHGSDNKIPNPEPAKPGVPSAQELFRTLRGTECQNDKQIVFGTDAIWHGSPVWQVEALKRLNLESDNPELECEFKRNVLHENTKRAFPVLG